MAEQGSRGNMDRLETGLNTIPVIDRAIAMSTAISMKRIADALERIADRCVKNVNWDNFSDQAQMHEGRTEEAPDTSGNYRLTRSVGELGTVYEAPTLEELIELVKSQEGIDATS